MHLEFIAVIISFIITIIWGNIIIPVLMKFKFGQTIRVDGPKRHLSKKGTPTMGGVIFIPSIALASLLFTEKNPHIIVSLISMIGFGLIGFVDDFIKIIKKRTLGLRANQKLIFQLALSFIIAVYARNFSPGTSVINAPFVAEGIDLGVLFIPFTVFIILGTVNSVNLTDGLDGLVSGITVIISFFFTLISLSFGQQNMAIFCAAISGACLGFLIFNYYPAKVFMGDTGSLGLGGALVAISVLTGMQIYLVFFGMIFIIETLSVILQVVFFRLTGKRIFKMSPIHHHFELSGWKEPTIVFMFWCFTILTGILGLIAFYYTYF
ncbi:MAG: phospho-N-acetylmuramoyl-pentapeptide-transferase [Tepidanaerobacteraceae bacterium]